MLLSLRIEKNEMRKLLINLGRCLIPRDETGMQGRACTNAVL